MAGEQQMEKQQRGGVKKVGIRLTRNLALELCHRFYCPQVYGTAAFERNIIFDCINISSTKGLV